MKSVGYDQFHMKCDISCSSLPDFSFVTISIYIVMFLFSVIMDISELNNLTADDVNNYDEYGETYLIKAARTKNPERATELLGALISKGADVNIMSKWHGYTALWHAVNTNCRESVELLLQANANPNIGHPPIVIASRYPDDVNFVDIAAASESRCKQHRQIWKHGQDSHTVWKSWINKESTCCWCKSQQHKWPVQRSTS